MQGADEGAVPPYVVGLYGVSGVGKSTLLRSLEALRPEWNMTEGCENLLAVMNEGGLDKFLALPRDEKTRVREDAIRLVARRCAHVALVTGHFSFPEADALEPVFTDADGNTYSQIIYLDHVSAEEVAAQRAADHARVRSFLPTAKLSQWMEFEKGELRRICKERGIDFVLTSELLRMNADGEDTFPRLVERAIVHQLRSRVQEAERASFEALQRAIAELPRAECYLLIDGDRTLSPEDTASHYFQEKDFFQLCSIFKRHKDYCFEAFWEAAALYGKTPVDAYQLRCKEVAASVPLYVEWVDLIRSLPSSCHAVLVSSGIRDVWTRLLERYGILRGANIGGMSVIAGNRTDLHGYLVDAAAKEEVAKSLRATRGGAHVFAFGDSKVDEAMLHAADRAYVVVDKKRNRSLLDYVRSAARQPSGRVLQLAPGCQGGDATPLHIGIPVSSCRALGEELAQSTFNRLHDFTHDLAAQNLATTSRRADLSGPDLQRAHVRIGNFLAERLLSNEFLPTPVDIPHVQGGRAKGVGVLGEKTTAIVALMRAGEPMARGVYDTFPQAMFVHHEGGPICLPSWIRHVILVDSVINTVKSICVLLEQLQAVQQLRVMVVSGVMQCKASLKLPRTFPTVRFYTLRVSSNEYTGSGGTDTGNRLFGTMGL
mmetsp:Transcript_12447/g.26345  ORF Transcript_12447/g.26345 Transcript_12447/m.26345 type:complete len:657 (+) Transcript_12447:203-2173(+)